MHTHSFAILLPIRIEESGCIKAFQREMLSSLAQTLIPRETSEFCVNAHVYLAIDENMTQTPALREIEEIFSKAGISCTQLNFSLSDGGKICKYWRVLARRAYEDGRDFFILLGDDVEMKEKEWMISIVHDFEQIRKDHSLTKDLFGFGCVALKDLQAPNFPTFPIVHKLHLELLGGHIFDDGFINQDADPFLFALYRRFQSARFASIASCKNFIGGVEVQDLGNYVNPRYSRQHFDWVSLIDKSVDVIRRNALTKFDNVSLPHCYTIDVVVPTFRMQRHFINPILSLKAKAKDVNVKFIIVVDNPGADVSWLRDIEKNRPDLLVRVNPQNLGASATRNNGIKESSAEFILFLDDDLYPSSDILDEYVKAIQSHPNYDGYVGYSELPPEDRIFPTAVHFSGVSFFWKAPRKLAEVPWGITANLLVRRSACQEFDINYIKTGGGEDIDFCLKLQRQPLCSVPNASIVHPWWDNGNRCYHHFFNWAQSDSRLQEVYPQFVYVNYPDAVESLVTFIPMALLWKHSAVFLVSMILGVLGADVLMDIIRIYGFEYEEEPQCQGFRRFLAAIESSMIKNYSALGRMFGHWKRGRFFHLFMHRFDWFCGVNPQVVQQEKFNGRNRFIVFSAVFFFVCWHFTWYSN